ncbi:MAG TPA: precorrin-2 C(20)-methyltransferase [Acidimicrobiales bacterium]|nr:precorrin-2 C(20)-methyltransferase [Acidimicrobiales bacterium]
MRKSSLYLPDRLKAALTARAGATGRSEAELIRDAIEAALAADPADTAGPGRTRPEQAVPGRLVGVGVGPGEADLLTLRAVAALRRADRVLAPSTAVDAVGRAEAIVRQAVPGLAVERVPFAMAPSRSARDRSVDRAAAAVAAHLQDGEEVAWITLGDPLVYSTFSAVAAGVVRRRPATVVASVPGVMAFQALAARTGTVVADERDRLVVRTALEGEDLDDDLSDKDSTVVVYKGGRRLPELAEAAARAGRDGGAVVGELLGMPGERVGPLAGMAAGGPASYLATVIVPAATAAKNGQR